MAQTWAFVQAAPFLQSDSSSSTAVVTFPSSCTIGNKVIFGVAWYLTADTPSVALQGDALTVLTNGTYNQTGDDTRHWIGALDVTNGSKTVVTATFGAGRDIRRAWAIEVSGLGAQDGACVWNYNNGVGTGADAHTSGNVAATAEADEMLLGWFNNVQQTNGSATGTVSAGTNFTMRGTPTTLTGVATRHLASASTAAAALFAYSEDRRSTTMGVTFKQASAPSFIPRGMLLGVG